MLSRWCACRPDQMSHWSLDLTDAQFHFKNCSPAIDTRAIDAMAESDSSILPWNHSVTDYSR